MSSARIALVTPADKRSRSGNRATAVRWARILRALGHRVRVITEYTGERVDMLLAIHAWRSAGSIRLFRERYPDRPLILCLSGTDIYRFQESDPETTRQSMELADALVCLHDLVAEAIPAHLRCKLHVIYQAARPIARRLPPARRFFEVCVVGHLRDEKDPLRAALAVRDLPATSRLRVVQLGKAHDERWARRARAEAERNPRYVWRGEVPHYEVRRVYARARAMVISSRMEGGANVVSEAIVAGLPVVASDIPGNVGLLGRDHPAYFPVGDTAALRALLLRLERDAAFLEALRRHGERLAPRFAPEHELAAWQALVSQFVPAGDRPRARPVR